MTAVQVAGIGPRQRSSAAPPRFLTQAAGGPSHAADVLRVSDAMGLKRQAWTQDLLRGALSVEPDGSWTYSDVVLHVPRRSGKTTILGPVAVHRCLAIPGAKVWVTAQTRQFASDLIVQEWSAGAVKAAGAHLRRAVGSEALEVNGGRICPFPASVDGLHGRTSHLVMVDEVWAHGDGQHLVQAIRPTLATTGGQTWWVSTAGDSTSGLLRSLVESGRRGAPGVFLADWGIPHDQSAAVEQLLHDERYDEAVDLTLPHHPGELVPRAAMLTDARLMHPTEWLRAYGNVWSEASRGMITASRWQQRRWQPQAGQTWPRPGRPLHLGVAADPVGGQAAILAAWRYGDRVLLDVVDQQPGTDWLPDAIGDRYRQLNPRRVAVDRGDPAASSVETAVLRGLLPRNRVDDLTAQDYAMACGRFVDAVQGGDVTHPSDPRLTDAVLAGEARQLGDRWVWDRRAAKVAPLVAATVALRSLERVRSIDKPTVA